MMVSAKPYRPTYNDELALTRHFVNVLEQRLAGRDALRKTHVHPLDWCHLGVLGPTKLGHQPVLATLDSVSLEGDLAAEGDPAQVADGTSTGAATQPVSSGHPPAAAENGAEASEPKVVADKGEDREGARRPPSAIGFEVLLDPSQAGCIQLQVDTSFCVFTKHLPTYREQTSYLDGGASAGAPLAEVVQRWPIDIKGIYFTIRVDERTLDGDGGVVQAVLDKTLLGAFASPDAERIWQPTRPKVDRADALKDEPSFRAFVDTLATGVPVDQWQMAASLEVRTTRRRDGKVRLGCYFKNDTPETPPLTKGKGLKDAFKVIGDVRMSARILEGTLHPIEILPVPHDYQYDRRVWAVGHNTSVRASQADNTIQTAALAVYEQPRIMTRDAVRARFSDLAADPFATLDAIYQAMCEYGKDWKDAVIGTNSLGLGEPELRECTRDLDGFRDEVRRFASGIAALIADARLLTAFKAANRVLGKLAKGYDSWRLFQLVFIVTCAFQRSRTPVSR
jgi:hypothetical protein